MWSPKSDYDEGKKMDEKMNDEQQMFKKIEKYISDDERRKRVKVTLSEEKTLFINFEVDNIDCILQKEISYIENISKKLFMSIIPIRHDNMISISLHFKEVQK